MSMRPAPLSRWDDATLLGRLDRGEIRTLRYTVWDLFPSVSGMMERVEIAIRPDGDGYAGVGEVVETDFGIHAAPVQARWTRAELEAFMAAARASDAPDVWVDVP